MTFIAKGSGEKFAPAPQGTHVARCVQLIDLGTQRTEFYDPIKKEWIVKYQRKILLGWELPDESNDAGEPFMVWKRYTLSLHEAAKLRHHLRSWRGRDFTADEADSFDVSSVVNKPCLVTVVHNESKGNTYANVDNIAALPKGSKCPERINDIVTFDLDEPNMDVLNSFSDRLQETVRNSPEGKKLQPETNPAPEPQSSAVTVGDNTDEPTDDVPF